MKLSRRQLISAGAGAWSLTLPFRAQAQLPDAPKILHIYCSGGWDPTMVFDSKIGISGVAQESGASLGVGGASLPFVDHISRPAVSTFFSTYGSQAAIVNGISTGSMSEIQAIRNMYGTIPTKQNRHVDWLTYYAASLNPVSSMPHTVINAPYLPGEYSAYAIRLTSDLLTEYQTGIPLNDQLNATADEAIATFHTNAFVNVLGEIKEKTLDFEKVQTLSNFFTREATTQARVSSVLTTLGSQGAEPDLVRHGKIAVELFQSDSQCVTIQAGARNAWNTTSDHFSTQSTLFEDLFDGLNQILSYAATRGISDNLLVLVTSERGRSPQLNAVQGKGPWAVTSALLWGKGIRGGAVAGLSDASLRSCPIDPLFVSSTCEGTTVLTMDNIWAGIYLLYSAPIKPVLDKVSPLSPIFEVPS